MINMKLLEVLTPPYIDHGCSTQKMFLGGDFIVGEFSDVNVKNCGHRNVIKHIEIKVSDKYVTLDISLKFFSL